MNSRDISRFASAALLATTLSALPASASADASQSASTPEQICGSGFGRVADGTIPVTDVNDIVRGHVHLLYNARTGENCVVTIKSSFVGQPTMTRAVLYRQGIALGAEDEGAFRYYAGPVIRQARDRCVLFQGIITNLRSGEKSSSSSIQAFGGSPKFGNCGSGERRRRLGS